MWEHSIQNLFEKGGWVMWPLLTCSVLGVALILDRLLVFTFAWQRFDRLLGRLGPVVRQGRKEQALQACRGTGPLSRLATVYLEQRDSPVSLREDVLQRDGARELARFEVRFRALGFIGQVSPMLGLLGTVTGLVSCFHEVEKGGGQAHPSQLTAGIWEALLTTVFGLVIAIPCLAVYYWCSARVDALAQNFGHLVCYLDQWSHEAEVATASPPLVDP